MNLMCWMLGHKWENNIRILARNNKWGSGKVVVRKCERCGKADVSYEAIIEPQFPFDVEIAAPSITRKLSENASISIEGTHKLDTPLEMATVNETNKKFNKKVSKSTSSNKS